MTTANMERTAVLVVRVWIETGLETGLRARITATREIDSPAAVVTFASTVDSISATVRDWLETFLAGPDSGVPD